MMDMLELLGDQNPQWREPSARRAQRFPFRRRPVERCRNQLTGSANPRAIALIGPRHVGKTVVLWQLCDLLLADGVPARSIVYCNLADERWPEPPTPRAIVRAAESGLAPGHPMVVLLDEIQVASRWHAWLKLAVDEGRHRFLVTGSAASALAHGARESGLGRWDELEIESFAYDEFCGLLMDGASVHGAGAGRPPKAFDRYLASSGFPAHAQESNESRVRERLRQDIVERAIVRDLQRLRVDVEQARRLFLHLVEQSGGLLNVQNRAADLGVNRKSLSKWLSHLLDTRLLVEVRPTTTRQGRGAGKAVRSLRARPKIHVADHGLVSAFAPVPAPLEDPHFRGQAFEAVVFRHLREAARRVRADATLFARHGDPQLSYWRGEGDARGEIDFIMDLRTRRIAIEVTAARSPGRDKLAKLESAARRAGADACVLVCDAIAASRVGGVDIVPIEPFAFDPCSYLEIGK
jgi:predicted AAA+ superfamily ATPase